MKSKKGFTLIELLAVIIILAIIMLIAIPSVTNYINNSRKESYADTAKELLRGAGNLVNSGELDIYDPGTTYYIPSTCIKTESGGNSPFGKFNPAYIITTYDGEGYNYYWTSTDEASMGVPKPVKGDELSPEHIVSNVEEISTDYGIGNRENIKVFNSDCSETTSKIATGRYAENDLNGRIIPIKNCEYNGNLVQGAEFVEGQYTYHYKPSYTYYNNGTQTGYYDGWGVVLTDKESTDPVTTELCTSINGEPIVSMAGMFYNTKSTSIDTTSFDTSNVVDMQGMFSSIGSGANTTVEIKGIEDFDTSKVKRMSAIFSNAFSNSNADVTMDLSKWNVSNVEEFERPFSNFGNGSNDININLSNWNIGAEYNLSNFFVNIGASSHDVELNLSNWKFSKAETISFFFNGAGSKSNSIKINISNWDFGTLKNIYYLFYVLGSQNHNVDLIGLETWDVSKLEDISYLFCQAMMDNDEIDLDLTSWDVSNIDDFGSFFRFLGVRCPKININLSGWKIKSTANIYDFFAYSCSNADILDVNLSNWDLAGKTTYPYLFADFGGSAKNINLNLSGWNTSGLTTTKRMFGTNTFSAGLNVNINMTGWDMSQVTDMDHMFYLTTSNYRPPYGTLNIIGTNTWDTRNATIMSTVFGYNGIINISSLEIYADDISDMFYAINDLNGVVTIHNNPSSYYGFLTGTYSSNSFTVNYYSSVTNIDQIMDTNHNASANIKKGRQL